MKTILFLAGDGIGPEITRETRKVAQALKDGLSLDLAFDEALIGGAAHDATGNAFPDETRARADAASAVFLGAVGGPKWDHLTGAASLERVALLGLRKQLGAFANLRPVKVFPQLIEASTLKREIVEGVDMIIVRELIGGIYFGEPRGLRTTGDGHQEGYNTLVYSVPEIERVVRAACTIARTRDKRVTSVDKANVLEALRLWREVATRVVRDEFPDITLDHLIVDNAAMQLIRSPKQFDVMVTTNMFGDILSDAASMLTGSLGMLPSAALNETGKGMYEPIHGSAPDIAGRNLANPLASILSLAMMMEHSLGEPQAARRIEAAVHGVLDAGLRTADIMSPGMKQVTTAEMGDAVVAALAVRASQAAS